MNDTPENLSGKSVLVVDDDPRNTFAMVSYLEVYGLKITVAENGFKAMEVLGSGKKIDIILLDMMMPEMDGYETIGKIRQDKSNGNIPILAVTAKAMVGDREKCMEAGATDYLSKPVDMRLLLKRITELLQQT